MIPAPQVDARLAVTPLQLARFAASFSVAVGVIVLAGWVFDIPQARSLIPGTISMKANTAISFVLAGMGLWLVAGGRAGQRAYLAGRLLGLAVAAAGIIHLAEYAFGVDLRIDQILFVDRDSATAYPGRMSLLTALAFATAGAALAFIDARPRGSWPAGLMAIVTSGLGYVGLVGYALGVDLVRVVTLQNIAINTGIALLVVSLGIMVARPDRGLGRLLYDSGPGPLLFRRLVPVAVVLTPAFAFLRLAGERAGLYSTATGVAIFTLAMVAAISGVLTWSARSLDAVDIARRGAEAAMRAARDEAEAASRAKSEFLGRMSHELRTPLNAVLGFAQLLEIEVIDERQREDVGQILRGGRHLLELINEVLDITRVESGQLAMSLEPVAVPGIVAEAIGLLGPLAQERGISLRSDVADPGLHVLADRHRLKQVLLNLVGNAVKHGRSGGSALLTCAASEDGRVRLAVSDDGPGIAPELMPRLFAPFERLGADAGGVEGTGLGLTLSRAIVTGMGGTIGVESRGGEGATFWFELAEAAAPAASVTVEAGSPEAKPAGRAVVVLHIEDNPANLRLVERALERRADVLHVPAMLGRLGLDLAREYRPDLVLLDLHLPDISGEEVLRQLQADPATRQVPVAIVSAAAIPGQVEPLLASGACAYLTKPVDLPTLYALIDDALGDPRGTGTGT